MSMLGQKIKNHHVWKSKQKILLWSIPDTKEDDHRILRKHTMGFLGKSATVACGAGNNVDLLSILCWLLLLHLAWNCETKYWIKLKKSCLCHPAATAHLIALNVQTKGAWPRDSKKPVYLLNGIWWGELSKNVIGWAHKEMNLSRY